MGIKSIYFIVKEMKEQNSSCPQHKLDKALVISTSIYIDLGQSYPYPYPYLTFLGMYYYF